MLRLRRSCTVVAVVIVVRLLGDGTPDRIDVVTVDALWVRLRECEGLGGVAVHW